MSVYINANYSDKKYNTLKILFVVIDSNKKGKFICFFQNKFGIKFVNCMVLSGYMAFI